MANIVAEQIVMAYVVMGYIVMAYIVMARYGYGPISLWPYIVMAYIFMAYIVMAYTLMAYESFCISPCKLASAHLLPHACRCLRGTFQKHWRAAVIIARQSSHAGCCICVVA